MKEKTTEEETAETVEVACAVETESVEENETEMNFDEFGK